MDPAINHVGVDAHKFISMLAGITWFVYTPGSKEIRMYPTNSNLRHSISSILAAVTITLSFGCSSSGGDSYTHLATAIDYLDKANAHDESQAEVSKADHEKMLDNYRLSSKSAKRIDFASMNKDYPTLGDRCKGELVKGLQWILEGYKKNNEMEVMAGLVLSNKFEEWYKATDEIRKSPRK
jgi:hypothetical protein